MSSSTATNPPRPRGSLSFRAVFLGLLLTAVVDLWLHWAELVLGGRGHTALAGTSIPVGAFSVLFVVVVVNVVLTRLVRPLAFTRGEMLVIYVMMTVSTVISSSGGLHFLIPTITAAFYYADSSNLWATKFQSVIPDWVAQKDPHALYGFYVGNSSVPWAAWRMQMLAWCGFMLLVALATLCMVAILRRQWVDRERLSFPTVVVPVEMIRDAEGFFSNRLLWIGFALPFSVNILNTIHLNVPTVPYLPTRSDQLPDLLLFMDSPPWNAIGSTRLSLYPFVIGIAYLLPVDMIFSCWFFYAVTKAEAVFGSASGITAGAAGGAQSVFPYIGHQGAGAFIGLTIAGLWLSRKYLAEVWRTGFGSRAERGGDANEPMSYRVAFIGLFLCLGALIVWLWLAGMRVWVAAVALGVSFLYMIAAARIRAETGNAWLFGPDVDAYKVMTTTFGTSIYTTADLTILAYLRSAIASWDLRCLSMPNQSDAYKMADALDVNKRKLTGALIVALALGIVVSFAIALMIWYAFGAGAKTDSWRTYMGRQPFDQLSDAIGTPIKGDLSGTFAIAAGFGITAALLFLRSHFIWWPFHPIGYAIANTNTMNQVWLPFFIAWLCKVLVLHYGGARAYRRSLPYFYGLILGDTLSGGLTTAIGCFTGVNVYPTNW